MTTHKRRPWGADVEKSEPEADGFPNFEHSSFTFEGEIERLGAISRNMSKAPRWARVVAKVLAVAMLLPIAVGLVFYVVSFFSR